MFGFGRTKTLEEAIDERPINGAEGDFSREKDGEKMGATESKKSVEKLLGWNIKKIENEGIGGVIKEGHNYEILEVAENEKIYKIKNIPQLTVQEAKLINEILEEFKEKKEDKKLSELIEITFAEYCAKNLIRLGPEQEKYLIEILKMSIFDNGVIGNLLMDDSIEEIACIGSGAERPIYIYEKNLGWMPTNFYFANEDAIKDIANRLAMSSGRRLTTQSPKMNAMVKDGSRLSACIDPIAFRGANFTIRKFRQNPFTALELVRNRTISARAAALLWFAMQVETNILIAGNTGSGKTTLLNALLSFLPKNERVIAVEETPEIKPLQKHCIKLSTAENLGIGMNELIVETLRMRPDRLIVGEIRSADEAMAFINTLLAGQGKGSIATFHSTSAKEALTRLKKLGVMEIDLATLDLIIVQKRWSKIELKTNSRNELRRVVEIVEIWQKENACFANELFKYDGKSDSLNASRKGSRIVEKICNGFGIGEKEFENYLKKAEKMFNEMKNDDIGAEEFFEIVNTNEFMKIGAKGINGSMKMKKG